MAHAIHIIPNSRAIFDARLNSNVIFVPCLWAVSVVRALSVCLARLVFRQAVRTALVPVFLRAFLVNRIAMVTIQTRLTKHTKAAA